MEANSCRFDGFVSGVWIRKVSTSNGEVSLLTFDVAARTLVGDKTHDTVVPCSAWGKAAEVIYQYLRDGQRVLVLDAEYRPFQVYRDELGENILSPNFRIGSSFQVRPLLEESNYAPLHTMVAVDD